MQLAFPGIDELELRPTLAQVRAGKIHIDQCGYCGLLVSAPNTSEHRADAKLGPCPRCGCATWWRQCSDVAEEEPGRHIVGPFYRSEVRA